MKCPRAEGLLSCPLQATLVPDVWPGLVSGLLTLMESTETLWPAFQDGSISMAKLAVHGCIEDRVDTAVEPGEVGSHHVHYSRSAAPSVQNVEQQEGDVAEDEAKEHCEAHTGHLPEL